MRLLLMTMMLLFGTSNSAIYDFVVNGIDGKSIRLSDFRGKKILIVNTASKCGYTSQYADLEALYKRNKSKLVIIGFPANNFANQEPNSNKQIREFCAKNYGVTFPMAEKVSVKGEDIHPLFKFLTEQDNQDFKGEVKWNFEKFLIDEQGHLIHRYRSGEIPSELEMFQ